MPNWFHCSCIVTRVELIAVVAQPGHVIESAASGIYSQHCRARRCTLRCMSQDLGLILKGALNVIRSHRKLVKGDKRREEAYNTGVRRIQEGYGDGIAQQIGDRVRSRGGQKQMLNSIMVLARYYPQGLLKHAYRKFRRIAQNEDSAE